jgi:hypothetical protein
MDDRESVRVVLYFEAGTIFGGDDTNLIEIGTMMVRINRSDITSSRLHRFQENKATIISFRRTEIVALVEIKLMSKCIFTLKFKMNIGIRVFAEGLILITDLSLNNDLFREGIRLYWKSETFRLFSWHSVYNIITFIPFIHILLLEKLIVSTFAKSF